MKKTGLEIVEMIAKGEQPKKIKHKWEDWEIIYTYNKATNSYEYDSPDDLDLIQFLNDEFEIIKEPKVWKPKRDEEYWVVTGCGYIEKRYWNDDEYDIGSYELGDCFRTEEEAQKRREQKIIKNKLKRYAEEHNTEEINWNNSYQTKFYLYYEIDGNLGIGDVCCSKHIGQIYFTSEEECKQAIEEIGEDNIKKLFEK